MKPNTTDWDNPGAGMEIIDHPWYEKLLLYIAFFMAFISILLLLYTYLKVS